MLAVSCKFCFGQNSRLSCLRFGFTAYEMALKVETAKLIQLQIGSYSLESEERVLFRIMDRACTSIPPNALKERLGKLLPIKPVVYFGLFFGHRT